MTIVRLTRARYSPKDPTGAKLRGGRWNSPGNSVLYASSTLSLACLEVLVHIREVGLIPPDYVLYEIEVPDRLVGPWNPARILSEQEALATVESPVLSREYGDEWYRRATNPPEPSPFGASYHFPEEPSRLLPPVQTVPSVIIPREMNYLISAAHPQFNELVYSEPRPFRFDPRLIAAAE
jgi:RES domain-containing protein